MAGKKGGKGGSTVSRVFDIAKPIADELGLTIWDVTFDKEGSMRYLRVLIEKPDGYVDMDDCEAMTRPLSKALDDEDPIDEQYMLEVGSPGLGRELKREEHFLEYLECPLRIRYIREKDDGSITVETEDGTKKVIISETAFIKLYDDEELPDEFCEDGD